MAVLATDAVLDLLRETAHEFINPRFRALAAGEVSEKSPGDLVTVADQESEVAITAALRAAYPDALILGEEAYAQDHGLLDAFRTAAHAFTVDPVDGTKNFVNGSPDHAVMVSETLGGEVVRAWIWQPQHELAYVAERGAGAFRNGERLRTTHADAPWRGVTSRRRWIGRALPDLPPLELTWVSCGIDYPHLIEGDAAYLLYGGTFPWDHAPGSLLLAESGGYLGTPEGRRYRAAEPAPTGLIGAVTPEIGAEIVGRLKETDWA